MAGVKVVTDNVGDIPGDLVARYNIDVVPLEVRLGTGAQEEPVGIDTEEFWRRVRATGAVAKTSAPSPGAFAQASSALATKDLKGSAALLSRQSCPPPTRRPAWGPRKLKVTLRFE